MQERYDEMFQRGTIIPELARYLLCSDGIDTKNPLIWQSEGNFSCCESGMENVRAFSSERNRPVSGRTGNPPLHCPEKIRSIQGFIQRKAICAVMVVRIAKV